MCLFCPPPPPLHHTTKAAATVSLPNQEDNLSRFNVIRACHDCMPRCFPSPPQLSRAIFVRTVEEAGGGGCTFYEDSSCCMCAYSSANMRVKSACSNIGARASGEIISEGFLGKSFPLPSSISLSYVILSFSLLLR